MFRDDFLGKRVLVTGHTGFKGSWLTEWLLELGAEVAGFSDCVPTSPALFDVLGHASRIQDFRGDVREYGAVKEVFRKTQPEVVFHLAAQALVRKSYDEPLETYAANVMGTLNVLEAIRHTKSVHAAVVVTTDKVYRNDGLGLAFRESDPLGGKDPYSASKACAEIAFSSYVSSFFSAAQGRKIGLASARAGNVIGGGDWSADRIVADCARSWARGLPVTLRNPDHVRPWQHVLEPVGAYLLLAHSLLRHPEKFHGESFNFGPFPDASKTVLQLLQELRRFWPGNEFEVAGQADRQNEKNLKPEARLLHLSIEKAWDRLGWKPHLSFEMGVEMTAEWYRCHSKQPTAAADLLRKQIREYSKK